MTEHVPHADRAYREARRAAARAHHPDAGGDADSLIRALREVDVRFARRPSSPAPIVVRVSRRRTVRRRLAAVRRILPTRRTYFDVPPRDVPPRDAR